MKIGIDISALHKFSKGRGIGFYTDNLIESLKKYTEASVTVIETENSHKGFDLIHYPFFDFFKPSLKVSNIPTIVTIHDVIPLLFPKQYPPGIKGQFNLYRQKRSLQKVKAIITDSKTSTDDVIKVLKIPESKVHTVYLASSGNFKKIPETEIKKHIGKYNLPEKFLLYTGGVNWNKNLLNQTEAALNSGLDIVYVGGGFQNRDNLNHPELASFKTFIEKYGRHPKIHMLGFVSDEELVSLMNKSYALLFASFYEGFGLPILESQSCATPVITSNNSSMREVAGKGAILVNPENVSEITQAIDSLCNEKVRDEIISNGLENINNFSWEKTAKETFKIYNEVLN